MKKILIILFLVTCTFLVSAKLSGIIVDSEIPKEYSKVNPGKNMLTYTNIILVREEPDPVDILIEYTIFSPDNKIIDNFKETKGTVIRITTLKEFEIPNNAEYGTYRLEIKASYGEISNIANSQFEVVPKNKSEIINEQIPFILMILLFAFIIIFFYQYRKFKDLESLIKSRENRNLFSRK